MYVSRKLLAMVKNEDDLAGTLAHEIGHDGDHRQSNSRVYFAFAWA